MAAHQVELFQGDNKIRANLNKERKRIICIKSEA